MLGATSGGALVMISSRAFCLKPISQAVIIAFISAATPATAQAQSAPQETEKIIITGQKRVELLTEVPAAISAYSGQSLQQMGLNSASELSFVSPSITFTQSSNTRGEGFSVRGVGTSIFSDTVEQSVGFVVDGVVIGRSGQASGDMLDVQRIEVLRGPQGMLFGKNASAGLISVITQKPRVGVTSAEINTSAGSHNEVKAQLIGNIPAGDMATVRLAYGKTTADGNVENVRTGERLNNRDEEIFRAKLLLKPTEKLEIYGITDMSKRRTQCCAWTARSAPAATPFGTQLAAVGIVPSETNLKIAAGAPFFQNADNRGTSVEINYDMGWSTLTSLTAYRTWDSHDNNDPDILPVNYLDRNSGDSALTQKTQEIRLTSPDGGVTEWVTGLYWYDQKNRTLSDQAGNLGSPFLLGTAKDATTTNTSKAIFGQASIRIAERYKLIGGARYTSETVALDFLQSKSVGALAAVPGSYIGAIKGEVAKKNFSWRLTGQADITRDHMAYVTAARGFKGPGVNTLGVSSNTLEVIQPEIPTTVEAGIRAGLFGGTTQLNLAVFKTKFEDFQAQVFDQNVNPGRFRVTNAGQLDTKGIEAELSARPVRGLTLTASGTHILSTFADFKNIACYTGQTILPFGTVRNSPNDCIRISAAAGATATTEGTGKDLPNSPRNILSLTGRYETALNGFKVAGQVNYFWRDKVSFSAAGDPNLVQPAYGLLGASFGFGALNEKWTLSFYGKNLLDKNFATNVISQPVLNAPGVYSQFVSLDARRSLGAVLNLKF